MDIDTIKSALTEITSEIDNMRDTEMLENALEDLELLSIRVEELADEHADTVEYDDIIEDIVATREILHNALDSMYSEEDEDDDYDY